MEEKQDDRTSAWYYLHTDNKGTVTAGELANRFEVSTRTIYRDIEALSIAGIPVYCKKGKNGGISLTEEFVLDKMLILGKSKTELKIVSPTYEEICAAILTEVDRGVTLMRAEGGYSGCRTKLVFSVVSNRELIKVEKLVHEIDPECFMVVNRVSEVRGKGFSIKKEYQ